MTAPSITPQATTSIPVYLDVDRVLDLLATLDDGLELSWSQTEQVSSEQSSHGDATTDGQAGVSGLLRIRARGSLGYKEGDVSSTSRTGDRAHTTGSLANILMTRLAELGILNQPSNADDWTTLSASSFIDVQGLLKPSPYLAWLRTVREALQMFGLFAQAFPGEFADSFSTSPAPTSGQSSKQGKKKPQKSSLPPEFVAFQNLIDGLLKSTDNRPEPIVVAPAHDGAPSVVVWHDARWLRDKSLTEIGDGTFRVFGKVSAVHMDRPVSLLRGTPLLAFGEDMVDQLLEGFEEMSDSGMNLPTLVTSVPAPVIEVLPVAIHL